MTKKTRPRQIFVKVYMSGEDKAGICAVAARLRMPVSEYARRVLVDYKVPESRINAEAIDTMRKVNADQARIGNQQKLNMDILGASAVLAAFIGKIEELYDGIRETQRMLRACILEASGRGGESGPE